MRLLRLSVWLKGSLLEWCVAGEVYACFCRYNTMNFKAFLSHSFLRCYLSACNPSIHFRLCLRKAVVPTLQHYIFTKSSIDRLPWFHHRKLAQLNVPLLSCIVKSVWDLECVGHWYFYVPKHVRSACCFLMFADLENGFVVTEDWVDLLNYLGKCSAFEE